MEATTPPEEDQALYRDLGWHEMDIKKLCLLSGTFFMGLRVFIYPPMLIKTRLQTQRTQVYLNMRDCFRKTLKHEGIRGLYKGFLTTSISVLPGQTAYITTMEYGRAHLPGNDFVRHLVSGALASFASSSIAVPVDVISQRLMIQRGGHDQRYAGGVDAFRTILRTEGLRGIYRGYWATLITYAPSSAIWWSTYHTVQTKIFQYVGNSDRQAVAVHAVSGGVAAATSAILTNPLDVIKTRLQVQNHDGQPMSWMATARHLIQTDGVGGFTKGVRPRILAMAPTSLLIVTVYEHVKKLAELPKAVL